MTKEEARRELKGTWNFRTHEGKVLVSDATLLSDVLAFADSPELMEAGVRATPIHRPAPHSSLHALWHT